MLSFSQFSIIVRGLFSIAHCKVIALLFFINLQNPLTDFFLYCSLDFKENFSIVQLSKNVFFFNEITWKYLIKFLGPWRNSKRLDSI